MLGMDSMQPECAWHVPPEVWHVPAPLWSACHWLGWPDLDNLGWPVLALAPDLPQEPWFLYTPSRCPTLHPNP